MELIDNKVSGKFRLKHKIINKISNFHKSDINNKNSKKVK